MNDESLSPPYLTAAGRRLLAERVGVLDATLHMLRATPDDDAEVDQLDAYRRAAAERDRLRRILKEAVVVEEVVPDDPTLVAIGDTVTIRLGDGNEETYVLVHAAEAAIDDRRISFDSPLGRALLFQQVGATVEVAVPAGRYDCTILSASRAEAPLRPGGACATG